MKMKPIPIFRLTLTPEAYALAVQRSKPIAGLTATKRPDGKWDVFVKPAVANLLRQLGAEKENLSDVVVRILKKKETANGQ